MFGCSYSKLGVEEGRRFLNKEKDPITWKELNDDLVLPKTPKFYLNFFFFVFVFWSLYIVFSTIVVRFSFSVEDGNMCGAENASGFISRPSEWRMGNLIPHSLQVTLQTALLLSGHQIGLGVELIHLFYAYSSILVAIIIYCVFSNLFQNKFNNVCQVICS